MYFHSIYLVVFIVTVAISPGKHQQILHANKCIDISTADYQHKVLAIYNIENERWCSYWCQMKAEDIAEQCLGWSFNDDVKQCNISFTPHVKFVDNSECKSYYNRLVALNLLAYWRLTNHSGGFNYGTLGSKADATIIAAAIYASDSVILSNTTESLAGLNVSGLAGSYSNFTFFTWMKRTSNNVMAIMEGMYLDTNTWKAQVWIWDVPTRWQVTYPPVTPSNEVPALKTSSSHIQENKWYFLATTATQTERKLYQDGSQVTSLVRNEQTAYPNTTYDFGSTVILGGSRPRNHPYHFIGELKCAGFSDQQLSHEQLLEIMKYSCN